MSIVCKFGGSCFTKYGLDKIRSVISQNKQRKFVVVSAMGKNFFGDIKTTDILISIAKDKLDQHQLRNDSRFKLIKDRHKQLIKMFNIDIDCESLFEKTFFSPYRTSKEFLVSRGEFLSAFILSKYLNFTFLDASQYICFDQNNLNCQKSINNLKKRLSSEKNCVLGGFYGADKKGEIRLMTRGGGDISGALLAVAVNATTYENYIDVDGLLCANPKIVVNPQRVDHIGYSQLVSLNNMGSECLLAQCVEQCKKHKIPVQIRSIFNPYSQGTIVNDKPNTNCLIAISSHKVIVYKTPSEDKLDKNIIERDTKKVVSLQIDKHKLFVTPCTNDNLHAMLSRLDIRKRKVFKEKLCKCGNKKNCGNSRCVKKGCKCAKFNRCKSICCCGKKGKCKCGKDKLFFLTKTRKINNYKRIIFCYYTKLLYGCKIDNTSICNALDKVKHTPYLVLFQQKEAIFLTKEMIAPLLYDLLI